MSFYSKVGLKKKYKYFHVRSNYGSLHPAIQIEAYFTKSRVGKLKKKKLYDLNFPAPYSAEFPPRSYDKKNLELQKIILQFSTFF